MPQVPINRVGWCLPVIPALGKQRWGGGDQKFKVIPGYSDFKSSLCFMRLWFHYLSIAPQPGHQASNT